MAEISRLSRLVNGIQRQVDLSSNTLVVGDIKIGGSGGTLLTKTSLDALLAISSNLASTANGLGASLVGIEDAAGQFTAATVEGALAESLDAAQAAQADADQAIADAAAAQATADAAIPLAQKGAANGVAPLGGDSKIAAMYLPSYVDDVLEYDELADFPVTGEANKIYIALDTEKTYRWSGSVYVEVSPSDVNSVNGQTGIVVLDTDDVAEGTAQYFTDERAQDAAVVDSTAGDETNQAPSVSAIKDYIADQLAAINTDALARSIPAGESLAAASLFALRWGRTADAETAGRGYKADNDATSVDNFHVMGLALTVGAASAGNAVAVTKVGRLVATGHGFTVGQPIYLGAAGVLTNTAPTASGTAVVKLGVAEDANTIDVSIEIMGVN